MSKYHRFEVVENNGGSFYTKFLVGEEDLEEVVARLSETVKPPRERGDFIFTDTDHVSDSGKGTMMRHVTLQLRANEPMTTFLLLEALQGVKIVVEPGVHYFI